MALDCWLNTVLGACRRLGEGLKAGWICRAARGMKVLVVKPQEPAVPHDRAPRAAGMPMAFQELVPGVEKSFKSTLRGKV